MAAVRAGALGIARGQRYVIYSSTPAARDWSERTPGSARSTGASDAGTSGGAPDSGDAEGAGAGRGGGGGGGKRPGGGRGYGVAVCSAETARIRWTMRRRMLDIKLKLCDWTLYLALFGLVLAVIDVEVGAALLPSSEDVVLFGVTERMSTTPLPLTPTPLRLHFLPLLSLILRSLIMASTVMLVFVLLAYHVADAKVYLIETGADSWRVGITTARLAAVAAELALCAVCPIPDTGTVTFPLLGQSPLFTKRRYEMPVNVLLSFPMFGRMYLLARYIVMHSSQYQDCATRTIASLNHIAVDFRFVVKSALYERPLTVLSTTTAIFWLVMAWMITQCERYAFDSISGYQHYLDFVWFVIITFFSIGYGDVQVHSICGRAIALFTAVLGTLFASILIALVARRMTLTSSEKRVNHLIAESQLTISHKNAAARVLQFTWRAVLRRREAEAVTSTSVIAPDPASSSCADATRSPSFRLRLAQRRLLTAILTFRRSRWRLRMQLEDEDDFFTARKAFLETEERLSRVRKRQAQLNSQMSVLYEHVQTLTSIIR